MPIKVSTFLHIIFVILIVFVLHHNATSQTIIPLRNSNSEQSLEKPLVDDYWHFHNVGNIGLTVTNYGLLGQGYSAALQDQPSCQYRFQSSREKERIEHFSYAGLWIGGIGGINGEEEPLVSTAIVDGVFDYGESGFEFTNSAEQDDVIKERSSIVTSPLFDPIAISHQDFICDFTDQNLIVPGTEIDIVNHTPLGINVHLESYAWNYSYADAFVIFNYTFVNISDYTIRDIYAGLWVDASVANMNYTNAYEPGGGFTWYDNLNGFDRDYNMGYQFDFDGDNGYAESYLGIRALGTSVTNTDYQVYYDQWQWNNASIPDFFMPISDEERYQKLSSTPPVSPPSGSDDLASWMILLSIGSLGDLEPGDTLNVVFAVVCGFWAGGTSDTPARRTNLRVNSDWAQVAYNGEDVDGDGKLDPDEDLNKNGILDGEEDQYKPELDLNSNGMWDLGEEVFGDEDGKLDIFEDTHSNPQRGIVDSNGVIDRYILPSPPPSPNLAVIPGDRKVTLLWDDLPENFEDPITREKDFEGYRIYSSPKTFGSQENATLLAQFDIIDSTGLGYETGFEAIRFDTTINGIDYKYRFVNDNLLNGWPGKYFYSVTSYDKGNPANKLQSMESSINENITYAVPGKPVSVQSDREIYVYPNPYKASALWDGSGTRDRLIWFANLPEQATIRIYSLAGDLIDEIKHDADNYTGGDVNRLVEGVASQRTEYSGGEHAWDLITRQNQAIATGLYLFTVKDEDTGDIFTGKFLVIK
jgi:hypothetical protein